MDPARLARWLLAWAVGTLALSVAIHASFALREEGALPTVVSVWAQGQRVARVVRSGVASPAPEIDEALARHPGATRVEEQVLGRGPVARWPEAALSLSFVPGQDGVEATLDGRTAYASPDDLLAAQAYDRGIDLPSLQLSFGLQIESAYAILAPQLGCSPGDVASRAALHRVRMRRVEPPAPRVTPDTLTPEVLLEATLAEARHLARGVGADGRFRYLVDAPTNQELPGYDWPRHAGATYFLAQVARHTKDADVSFSALRAAALLRDHALGACGDHRCLGEGNRVDLGSSALGLLAFVEVARHLDPGYRLLVPELVAFLRAQQRPDGEFMHLYDRARRAPVDVQSLYYSGEAAFALARAGELLHDDEALAAAEHALDYLVHRGWRFFGSRYYWGEEHWTCQALGELSGRAPRPLVDDALDFCLGWAAYGRTMMYGPGEAPFDVDGAYGVGPLVTPRLTPAASRTEAAIATLDAARRAGRPERETAPLEQQIRRTLALLVRRQLHPGPAHLFVEPEAVDGAMPATEVDWMLRIDYEQHSGGAFVRWVELGAGGG